MSADSATVYPLNRHHPPEAIGNGLVRPGQVVRQLKRKPVRLSQTDEWAWPEAEEGGGGAGLRLLQEWARQGYRLPDPRREGDFALHLRLLEAAFFGDRGSGFGAARRPAAQTPVWKLETEK